MPTACAWVSALFLASSVFGHTVALRLLLLAAAIVLAAVVVSRKKTRGLPSIWLPFLLWGTWAALTMLWSLEPERTLKEWRNEVFYTGAALWVCYVGAQARNAIRIYAAVLATAAGTACLVALYEFPRGWDAYAAGWHGGPGDHSSALLVLMPCVAMAGWYAVRAQWPRWTLACIAALAVTMFLSGYTTLNRTIWLGFAVEFLVLGGLLLGHTKPTAKRVAAAGTLAVAAVVGCGAVIMTIQTDRQALGVARAFDHDSRIALWPQVSERIAERPIAGHGFGRGMLRESLQAEFKTLDPHLWHAHNLFLEALLQTGVAGLALLVLLLAAIVRIAWRYARYGDDAVAACGIALLGVVAGMLVRNMTDFLLVRQNALLFWGVVGVLMAFGPGPWRARS
jgi:O-antigen ligase